MSHPPGTILCRARKRGRPLSPNANANAHAQTRPRPHKIQADTLHHLACLIDRSLDDTRLLDPQAVTARHLGCATDDVAESTVECTRFRYRLAALALAAFLDEHPGARISAGEPTDRPQWEILSLGERHLPYPSSICAFFPPGRTRGSRGVSRSAAGRCGRRKISRARTP